MSAISDLARSFEKRSETQAGAIEQTLADAYRRHEQSLLEQLRSSEQSLQDAIRARESSLVALLKQTEGRTRVLALSSWKWALVSLGAVILVSAGLLWWMGQKITSNAKLLAQQSALMERAPGLGVEFHKDANGEFIILPRGAKSATGWTFDDGKRQAIKIER